MCTLKDGTYEWYKNYILQTFKNWNILMRAFLKIFRLKIGQSNVFTVLFSLRQGKRKEITSYIWQFKVIIIQFVKILLTNDTFIQFFIQGFNNEGKIRKNFKGRPKNLEDTKKIVWIIEDIDKEQEKMSKKEDHRISNFISIHASNVARSTQ